MEQEIVKPRGAVNGVQAADVDGKALAAAPALLDRPALQSVRIGWEMVAWVSLLLVSAVARFYNVGVRAMSHDESLHALYSYYLYDAGNYHHDPMMHGPLLFHVNAFIYFLFGDNDATARLFPVLAGIGVVAMSWFYRRYLGRVGALAMGVMVSISPSLLFHSRYIRNDIYIALFALVWVFGLFRYLEDRSERRSRWLILVVAGMVFGFISKENQFIQGALFGAFFAGYALWQVMGHRLFMALLPALFAATVATALPKTAEGGTSVAAILLLGLGILATVLWLGVVIALDERWKKLWRSSAADLAVLMLTLVLPFTAPFLHYFPFDWDPMAHSTTQDLMRSAFLVAVVVALAVGIAFVWFKMRKETTNEDGGPALTFSQWATCMAAFWGIAILFFTTFFTNTVDGLATGVVGSLGYWLAQHGVQRGSQPPYYYLMIGLLYEYLPIVLTIGAYVAAIAGLRQTDKWEPRLDDPESGSDKQANERVNEQEAEHGRHVRVVFVVFLLWWVIGAWLGYSIAGEKMPWLLTHIALPMCVAGGWWLGRLWNSIDWPRVFANRAQWLIAIGPLFLITLIMVLFRRPSFGRTISAVSATMQWIVAVAVTLALAYAAWNLLRRVGKGFGLRLMGIGGLALLLILTLRTTYMLNYVNFDLATEYLVYAHGTPDIKRALREIDLISERTVGERNITIAYDNESSWPLSWYMRLYPNARFYGANPTSDTMSAAVIIVGAPNYEKVHPYVTRDYIKRTYRRIWWPDQGYFNLTWERFWTTLRDPQKMKNIWQIVFYRRYADPEAPGRWRSLTQWPNRNEFEMWIRRDLAAQIWNLSVTPVETETDRLAALLASKEVEVEALNVYSGSFDGLNLTLPRAVAVGPNGERVIADSGNHRIVVLNANGEFQFAFGGMCRLGEGVAGGCTDQDGTGPMQLGDGQFQEPWGVAVGPDGTIFVADTWNGRIQVFDSSGRFLRSWGVFGSTNGETGDPYALFGPRGLATDAQGNLYVADTGNKRILHFTPDGQLINQVGGGGAILGRFEEPVGVAVDPNDGSVYVSDAWNRRVQKLDANLVPVAEWPVPSWESREIFNKPFIAAAANGDVYVTDPQAFRVIVFDGAGEIKASFGDFGAELNRFGLPNGLAVDNSAGVLLVADADNHRILVLPLVP